MLQANFGTVTWANSQQRKLRDPCARSLARSDATRGVARSSGLGREGEHPADGPAVHGCPRPATTAPRCLSPSPAREANESAAAAVSCFVAQVRGRAGAAPLHAGFPGTLPLAPLVAPRRCLAPPDPPRLLTKGFRIAIGCPCHPPCHHLAAASPQAACAAALKAVGREARPCSRVCAELPWGCWSVCTRTEENLAWSAGRPPPGGPRGAQEGLGRWPPARRRVRPTKRAPALRGPPRGKAESPGSQSQCSLPGLGVLGKSKVT